MAIEEALAGEDDDDLRAYLGLAAAAQFDDRLVPPARVVLDEDPDDPERGGIRELLVVDVAAPIERGSQAGRNAPCPCGSGKKYKRCCLPDARG